MKLGNAALCLALVGSLGIATSSWSADKGKESYDYGKREFGISCAVCHGQTGKGDGSFNEWLKVTPTDLTTLSKRNGGVFPYQRIYGVIDGREFVKTHGTREMPIWGREFAADTVIAGANYMEMQYDMDVYARNRIAALIDYLNRMQVK